MNFFPFYVKDGVIAIPYTPNETQFTNKIIIKSFCEKRVSIRF